MAAQLRRGPITAKGFRAFLMLPWSRAANQPPLIAATK
jgi:hypothetical protein